MKLKPCPVCGRQPDVDECGPSVPGVDLGWYANCYSTTPREHCIGVSADTKHEAEVAWNAEAAKEESKTQFMTGEQEQAIYGAYLGICTLRSMCRKAQLDLAAARADELLKELSTAFPTIYKRILMLSLRGKRSGKT